MAQAVIVTIPVDENGQPKHELIRRKDGSEYGSVMVKTTQFSMSSTGILNKNSRSSYFRAKLDILDALVELGLKEGAEINKLFDSIGMPPVRIKRVESTEPAFEGHAQKMNPSNNELIFADEAKTIPVYMQDIVAPATEPDVLVGQQTTQPELETPEAGGERGRLN